VNGLPFCQISSWLSGRRLVSLPFSDHCTPLVENSEQLTCILAYLQDKIRLENWKYIELRPTNSLITDSFGFDKSKLFVFHKLDLRPSLAEIFRAFHKDCVQKKIQHAAREGIGYGEGRSAFLLTQFYHLFLMTRRTHGLPPQPLESFKNPLLVWVTESRSGWPLRTVDQLPLFSPFASSMPWFTSTEARTAGSTIRGCNSCCGGR
jgi:hypothetical protein